MANFRASLKKIWKNRPRINCLILLSSLPIEGRGCRQKKGKRGGKKRKKRTNLQEEEEEEEGGKKSHSRKQRKEYMGCFLPVEGDVEGERRRYERKCFRDIRALSPSILIFGYSLSNISILNTEKQKGQSKHQILFFFFLLLLLLFTTPLATANGRTGTQKKKHKKTRGKRKLGFLHIRSNHGACGARGWPENNVQHWTTKRRMNVTTTKRLVHPSSCLAWLTRVPE